MKLSRTTKCLALILCLSFLLSYSPMVSAHNFVSNLLTENINKALAFTETQKELYGLDEINFSALFIGDPINAYECINAKVSELDFRVFPIIYDNLFVALALVQNNSHLTNISTALVSELNKYVSFDDDFALIYDIKDCSLFTNGNIIKLTQGGIVCDNRDVIDEEIIYNASINTKRSAITTKIYDTVSNNIINTITFSPPRSYISVSVPYVSQIPPDPSYICWAASAASVVNGITGASYSAGYFAVEYYGQNYNNTAPMSVVTYLINTFNNSYSYSTYSSTPSLATITTSLSNGRPLCTSWSWSSSGGSGTHSVVIYAADTYYGYIGIMNPLSGFTGASSSGGVYSFVSSYSGLTLTLSSYYST